MKTRYYLLIFIWIYTVYGELNVYECPSGWEEYIDHCYRFVKDPYSDATGAKVECQKDGAYVLSVNNEGEHLFVLNVLTKDDPGQRKQDWWTSGRRQSDVESLQFYWEGDGTKIESFFYWHNSSIPTQRGKNFILYHYDGYKWGWILGTGLERGPFICEISKDDIYKIQQEERGPDYGVDNPDSNTIERGPKFVLQPQPTIHENINFGSASDQAYLECIADSYPMPSYEWYRERGGIVTPIDPLLEKRYTYVNGRLIIDSPSSNMGDDGNYQCAAMNKFGKILSNIVPLSFGYLQDFPKSPRSPVTATAYQWASIECDPPAHYPEVLYTWYKNDIMNFIRPELKPYIMISHDGRLYFSEVTADDIGNYYCIIYKPGQALAEGKVSMPTKLNVYEGSPGEYEPDIGSGFPLVYPANPKIGDNVRLECWASGTSRPQAMLYSWDKVEFNSQGKVIRTLPLPNHARLSDHNRVVVIPNIQLYDAGHFRCNVRRVHGQAKSKTVQLILQSYPYFILDLKDRFVDEASDLTWRCQSGGEPAPDYSWLKNGQDLNSTIPPEDVGRIEINNNVLKIKGLDAAKDDGMYQCVAKNMHGTRYSTGQLKVLGFKPSFSKYPLQPNQLATRTGNTTILCRFEAAPAPAYEEILWYKDDFIMSPGEEEGSRIRKMPNGHLYINRLEYSDSGHYKCEVTNSYGMASSEGNLTVLSTTTITFPPMDTSVPVNKTNFIHCSASYNPAQDVTYSWYQNGILLEFEKVFRLGENRYEIWRNPNYKRGTGLYLGGLYIMHAQYYNAGRYTCKVDSSAGSMTRSANVIIVGPPSQPAGVYINSGTISTESVVVQWKASGTNGRVIISYVIEAYNGWEGFWRIVMTNIRVEPDLTGTMTTNVTNLRPYSSYQIRIRAENVLGTSEPSNPSEAFTTLAVKPDKVPLEVGGGGGKTGDLTITWKPLDPWDHNGPGIGYRVFWKDAGDDEWDGIKDVKGNTGRFVTLVGESNFYRQYDIAVQAFNDIGEGPMSSVVRIRSAMGLPTAIAQNVRAQPFNATACLVHWEPVDDSREHIRGKLGGYRISYWKEYGEIEEIAPRVTVNGQAAEGLVIGLYPNTPYYFDVMVWNDAGNGPKSQYFLQRTLRNAPINQPVEVKIERRSLTGIRVTWRGVSTTQIEEPLIGYKVRIWREGEDIKVAKDYNSGKDTELFIDDLRHDILYKLRVFGYSRGGDGTMSSPAQKFMIGNAVKCQLSAAVLLLSALAAYFTKF